MPHAVEFLFARSGEAYRQEHTLFNDALGYVGAAKGSVGIYHGLCIEDNETLVNIVPWEKLEDHQNLMNDPTIYPLVIDAFTKVGDPTTLEMLHVEFPGNVAAALNAPVTSILHIQSTRSGRTNEELEEQLEVLSQLQGAHGSHGGCWGKAVDTDARVMVLGWDSIEDHKAYMAQEGVAARIRLLVGQIIDKFALRRFNLVAYKPLEV